MPNFKFQFTIGEGTQADGEKLYVDQKSIRGIRHCLNHGARDLLSRVTSQALLPLFCLTRITGASHVRNIRKRPKAQHTQTEHGAGRRIEHGLVQHLLATSKTNNEPNPYNTPILLFNDKRASHDITSSIIQFCVIMLGVQSVGRGGRGWPLGEPSSSSIRAAASHPTACYVHRPNLSSQFWRTSSS